MKRTSLISDVTLKFAQLVLGIVDVPAELGSFQFIRLDGIVDGSLRQPRHLKEL